MASTTSDAPSFAVPSSATAKTLSSIIFTSSVDVATVPSLSVIVMTKTSVSALSSVPSCAILSVNSYV